jgi:S1-C subfamily serine protease
MTSLARNATSTLSVFSPGSGGSGFYIADNYIVTNNHVVGGSTDVVTLADRDEMVHRAQVIYRDVDKDIAVIYTKRRGVPVFVHDLKKPSGIAPGDFIYALGTNSYNTEEAKTGTILAIDVEHSTFFRDNVLIKTDIKLEPGYSGGPVFDENNILVGINVGISSTFTDMYGIIIPFDEVKDDIMKAITEHFELIKE